MDENVNLFYLFLVFSFQMEIIIRDESSILYSFRAVEQKFTRTSSESRRTHSSWQAVVKFSLKDGVEKFLQNIPVGFKDVCLFQV